MNPPRPSRWRAAIGWLAFLSLAAAIAWSWQSGLLPLPPEHDPRAPLDVGAAPNWLTGYKLQRANSTPGLCLDALATSGMHYERVPDRVTAPGCGFDNAIRLRAGDTIALASPVMLSCRAALSFAMWERHALQPAAMARLGKPVVAVDHLGSYACRDVNTGEGPTGRRSRHATADAIDIAGFTTADRRRITVRRDWAPASADPEALFLREVHDGACRYFDGVLGPDYNAVHADHFHLETGGWRTCR